MTSDKFEYFLTLSLPLKFLFFRGHQTVWPPTSPRCVTSFFEYFIAFYIFTVHKNRQKRVGVQRPNRDCGPAVFLKAKFELLWGSDQYIRPILHYLTWPKGSPPEPHAGSRSLTSGRSPSLIDNFGTTSLTFRSQFLFKIIWVSINFGSLLFF